jgi:hypothetical protein
MAEMSDVLLQGIAFSGFRSFGSEALQRVGPMTKVHLLAGPNNSGKSNVLALAHRALPAFKDPWAEFQLADVDVPLQASTSAQRRLRVAILRDVPDSDLAEIVGPEHRWVPDLREALSGPSFRQQAPKDACWFEFELVAESEPRSSWTITSEQVHDINTSIGTQAGHLSTVLTGQRGGAQGEDEARILNRVVNGLSVREGLPSVALIGAFREIGPTSGELIEDEHNGPG